MMKMTTKGMSCLNGLLLCRLLLVLIALFPQVDSLLHLTFRTTTPAGRSRCLLGLPTRLHGQTYTQTQPKSRARTSTILSLSSKSSSNNKYNNNNYNCFYEDEEILASSHESWNGILIQSDTSSFHDDDFDDNNDYYQQQQHEQQTQTQQNSKVPIRQRVDMTPEEIPFLLMKALRCNDVPTKDFGLKLVWEFTSDITKHIFQYNITEFIESAHETANTMPTSFYGVAMYGLDYIMETSINYVGGNNGSGSSAGIGDSGDTSTGGNRNNEPWIATQIMKTKCSDGRIRRWQWELRKTKRPPNLNCWYVEQIGSSDRNGQFEPE